MDIKKRVASGVIRCRLAAGITQAELSARLGIDRAYVSGLEGGRRNPTIQRLDEIAQALGVDVAELLSGAN